MPKQDGCFPNYELPHNLIEEILVWLPMESLCRFRLVSKQWNDLISSTKFITTKWTEAPPNRMPWLVVPNAKMSDCWAYCFFTGAWRKTSSISLSFLLQEHGNKCEIYCDASATGIFLVDIGPPFSVSTVCNPITRTSLKLPPLSSIRTVSARGIVGNSPDTYRVVAVGLSCQERAETVETVEIYDSSEKSWRIAGQLPGDLWVIGSTMVFCEGYFYCLAAILGGWGIVGFNITEGISISAPLPEMANDKNMTLRLLTCGSRVLVSGGIIEDGGLLFQELIIWEFDKMKVDSSSSSSLFWKLISRLPPSMCKDLNRALPDVHPLFSCIGMGDCIFIVYVVVDVVEVVAYSLSQKSWSLLPSCLIDEDTVTAMRTNHANVMAFEPRPNMKV